MRTLFFLLLLPFPTVAQLPASGTQNKIQVTENHVKQIDSIINVTYPSNEPGASVLLVQNDRVLLRKGYGLANVEFNVPVSPDNVFAIASMTKYFTAVSILLLQEQGKLKISDDVRKYIPAYNTHGKVITLEHLLSHTAGILNDREFPAYWATAKLEASRYASNQFVEEYPLLFEPGSDFNYSNPSFRLLGFVIEKVSGQSYYTFLKQNILDKLSLTQTYSGSSAVIPKKASTYAFHTLKKIYERQEDGPYAQYSAGASGSLFSTVDDLYRWHRGLKEGKIITLTSLRKAWTPKLLTNGLNTHYGFGRVINDVDGHTLVGHAGGFNGSQSYEWQLPDNDIYFVILSNQGRDFARATLAANLVAAVILGKKLKKAVNTPELSSLEGVYESLSDGSRLQKNMSTTLCYWNITSAQGKLFAKRTGLPKTELLPANDSTWYTKANPFGLWTFRKNKNGTVTSLKNHGAIIQIGPDRIGKKVSSSIPPAPQLVQIDDSELKKYSGVFQHESGTRQKITVKQNRLLFSDEEGLDPKELSYTGNNVFVDQQSELLYKFTPNKNGVLDELHYFDGRVDMVMKRIKDNY